ncbi:MAG: thiol-disulfide oxidoreductase DCC family protein [Parvularculaceae bacterium]
MNKATVYFDGDCPLCRREIAFYERRADPAAVAFVNIHKIDAATLGDGLTKDEALGRFHVRDADGTLREGAGAFAALWRRTPGFKTLGKVVGAPIVRQIADFFYDAFLIIRPRAQAFARWIERRSATRRAD